MPIRADYACIGKTKYIFSRRCALCFRGEEHQATGKRESELQADRWHLLGVVFERWGKRGPRFGGWSLREAGLGRNVGRRRDRGFIGKTQIGEPPNSFVTPQEQKAEIIPIHESPSGRREKQAEVPGL